MMDVQDFIVEATKTISKEVLKRNNFTKSFVGKVVSTNKNSASSMVSIDGVEIQCILPTNMYKYVANGDIVVVQDLHNNGTYMVIHGVIKGSGMGLGEENTVIHVFDMITNTVVSSVMQVWDESNGSIVSTTFNIS